MKRIALAAVAIMGLAHTAAASDYDAALQAVAEEARAWASDARIIDALHAQNAAAEGVDQAMIDAQDKQWRAEVGQGDAPLISAVADTEASTFLIGKRDASAGIITEIFVMDKLGRNVAMSDVTSDYWQGDEAKWQETYAVGADAVHISDIELDESTQSYQSQVSFTIVDPETQEPIGAITIGVDVGMLD